MWRNGCRGIRTLVSLSRRCAATTAGVVCQRHVVQAVWTRLSARRVVTACLCLLTLGWTTLFLHQTFHPDHLPPSTRLSAVPMSDFFWLNWVSGDYFKPARTLLSPLPDFFLLPSHGCRNASFIAVLVPSPPGDVSRRQLIRTTWGKAVKDNLWPRARLPVVVDVFFVIGLNYDNVKSSTTPSSSLAVLSSQLTEEAQLHDDLIVGKFADTYRNLSRKTLTGLNWARQHCAHSDFVMKVDQDTFVDFPRLTDFLLSHRHELRNAVIGKLYFNSGRLESGKWKVLPEEYPLSLYPTFAGGPCYVISSDAVGKIVDVSQYMAFFPLEDVLVTGILARTAGVRRLYMQQLQNWKMENLCALLQKDSFYVSVTDLSPEKVTQLWTMLQARDCDDVKTAVA